MNGKSSAELEREAENVRAEVSRTAESLRERMTPGELVDEAMDYLRHSDSAVSLNTLKTQVRDNPLALAVAATGLAWLMTGSRTARADGSDGHASHSSWTSGWSGFRSPFGGHRSSRAREWSDGRDWPDDEEYRRSGMSDGYGSSMRDAARGAGDTMRETASGAGEAMRNAASSTRDTAANMRDRISEGMSRASEGVSRASEGMSRAGHATARAGRAARDQTGSMAGGIQHTFSSLLDREPLILGALGLAIGAAIGAMLPSTHVEDETFGEQGDKLRRGAKDMMREGYEGAKDVAQEAYRSGREAADEQGLTPKDEKPLADKISATVAAGAEAAKAKAAEKMKSEGDTSADGKSASAPPSGAGGTAGASERASGTSGERPKDTGGAGEKLASTGKNEPRPGGPAPMTTDDAGHTTSSSSEGPARTSPFPPRT